MRDDDGGDKHNGYGYSKRRKDEHPEGEVCGAVYSGPELVRHRAAQPPGHDHRAGVDAPHPPAGQPPPASTPGLTTTLPSLTTT